MAATGGRARIRIEYCVECLFLGRALEIAQALLERFPGEIEAVELKPGHEGVFTVMLAGEALWTVGEDGRPPAPETIVQLMERKLQRAV